MYKLIASDIDGTLINSKNKISPEDVSSIKACVKNGIKFVLTSGRSYQGVMPFVKELSLEDTLHICSNGNVVIDGGGVKRVMKCFDTEEYEKLIDHLRKTASCFVVIDGQEHYSESYGPIIRVMTPNNGDIRYNFISDAKKVKNPIQVCAYKDTEDDLKNILSVDLEGIYAKETHRYLIDFVPKGISKFDTLLEVASSYNIKREEIICVGDAENDADMIKRAGLGICVKNALPTVKEISDVVIPFTNNENPMSYIIEKYIYETR